MNSSFILHAFQLKKLIGQIFAVVNILGQRFLPQNDLLSNMQHTEILAPSYHIESAPQAVDPQRAFSGLFEGWL